MSPRCVMIGSFPGGIVLIVRRHHPIHELVAFARVVLFFQGHPRLFVKVSAEERRFPWSAGQRVGGVLPGRDTTVCRCCSVSSIMAASFRLVRLIPFRVS